MATTANSNLCGRLVESDRVEGISVYDLQGTRLGNIERLMIDPSAGQVVSAVVFRTHGLGHQSTQHEVLWKDLWFDMTAAAFRTASMGCCPIVPLLASDHVVGRPVFDQADRKLGTIKCLVIEKSSGGINYVEVDRHVLLGLFIKEDHIPWHSLAFVERLNGYRFSGTTLP